MKGEEARVRQNSESWALHRVHAVPSHLYSLLSTAVTSGCVKMVFVTSPHLPPSGIGFYVVTPQTPNATINPALPASPPVPVGLTSSMGSRVLYRMLTACSMLLMKVCGAVQRGVSRIYSTTVGKVLANSSAKKCDSAPWCKLGWRLLVTEYQSWVMDKEARARSSAQPTGCASSPLVGEVACISGMAVC